jgi:hypothetical protein
MIRTTKPSFLSMISRFASVLFLVLLVGCGRLETLTEDRLDAAEELWEAEGAGLYTLVVRMSGERLETGLFEALVRDGRVVGLRRNGQVILPQRAQDYSIAGLFGVLRQELALSEKPALLGAPPGFSAHLLVRFDPVTGRLLRYRRTVGGANSNIEIEVVEYLPQ